jgi:5'-nucleotidase
MDIKEETTQHKFLFIDMDGTIADYNGLINFYLKENYSGVDIKHFWDNINTPDYKKIKDSIDRSDRFYFELQPISDEVVDTIKKLDTSSGGEYKVYFLSSPEIKSNTCHSDKNEWIKLQFGPEWCKRLILTKDKTLVGVPHALNFLIDDRLQQGINPHPMWKQIYFLNEHNKVTNNHPRIINWNYEEVKRCLHEAGTQILNKSNSYLDLLLHP